MGVSGNPAWEYLVVAGSGPERLDALGDEGWELVAAGGDGAGERWYLKRRAPTFRERVTLEQRSRYFAALGIVEPGSDRGTS